MQLVYRWGRGEKEARELARVTILLNDSDHYISVTAEEFHEDEGFLKAYTSRNELVAVVDIRCVKCAYKTEEKMR